MSKQNVIGTELLSKAINAGEGLRNIAHDIDEFAKGEGVYRINDDGDYVGAREYEEFWGKFPGWYSIAWIVTDNGQYTFDDVANMTMTELMRVYMSDDFDPEHAYYTEV